MKRYGNLFEKIYDMDNLKEAHKNARKDKLFYKEVKMVDSNPEYYLKQIQDMLINKTYKVSKYNISIINDAGKDRELMKLPYFPDRIIQWAILLQIERVFMEVFCYHTCASIKGRGIKKASQLVTKYMRDVEGTKYCLKIDVAKFYPSINHDILKQLLRRKFKDKDLLQLLDMIIDSYPDKKGIPIGSYLSQFFANFYLSYFDHWLKEEKEIKYVVRYMDDIVIFGKSSGMLHQVLYRIDGYFQDKLDIRIKYNWQIFPTAIRGVDFVGYRHFYGYKLLRKSTCKKFKKKMLAIKKKKDMGKPINYNDWCSANSYDGWLKWCNSWRLRQKYLKPIAQTLNQYYKRFISKKSNKYNVKKEATHSEKYGNRTRFRSTG
jgi:hypothetical protein